MKITHHIHTELSGIPIKYFYDLVCSKDQGKIREFIAEETDITRMFLGYYVPEGTRGIEIAVYFYSKKDLAYWLLRVG